jgi:hypothetical protein
MAMIFMMSDSCRPARHTKTPTATRWLKAQILQVLLQVWQPKGAINQSDCTIFSDFWRVFCLKEIFSVENSQQEMSDRHSCEVAQNKLPAIISPMRRTAR